MSIDYKWRATWLSQVALVGTVLGCSILIGCGGSGNAVLPEGNLTPEQLEKMKAEDAAVENEESQGKLPKRKVKK
jgi:hypothetical protein